VAVKMVDPVLMQTFCAQIDALGVDLPPGRHQDRSAADQAPRGGAGPAARYVKRPLRGL
jgi:hypothetical protein